MKLTPDQFEVNEARIVARMHTVMFVKNEPADIYVLLDAASSYVLGHLAYLGEAPSLPELTDLFKRARKQSKRWPKKLIVTREDPVEDPLKGIAADFGIAPEVVPLPYLDLFLRPLNESFARFRSGKKRPFPNPRSLALMTRRYRCSQTVRFLSMRLGREVQVLLQDNFARGDRSNVRR